MVFDVLTAQADFGTLALRIILGILLAYHGYPKITSQRKQTMQWLASMGIPGSSGPLVGLLEFVGGIFLILGFLTPIVSILLAIEFVGTTIMSKTKLGKRLLLGYELDLLYLAGALALIFLGGGAYSLDRLLNL